MPADREQNRARVYATLTSLGFVSTVRTDAEAVRSKNADSYALTKGRADAAVAELKALSKAPRGNRKTETQRAERRQALERTVAAASEALDGSTAMGSADPVASSLATYAIALGLHWSAEQISPWISAAVVLFFEIASGASLIVVSVFSAPALPIRQQEDSTEKSPHKRAGVLEKLREHGELNGSLTTIGKTLGLGSKSTTFRVLNELADTGAIKLHANGDGTRVALS